MIRQLFLLLLFPFLLSPLAAQERVAPIIKDFGAIFDIPTATVKPDPTQVYKIVVDVFTGAKEPTDLSSGLNNVARMINLHAVGGVPAGKIDVVLAMHGGATFATLNNEAYQKKFGVDNPNAPLVKALKDAGVKLVVCGQSLLGREIPLDAVLSDIEIGTSMLTTVSTYQLKGYAVFRF
jgi:intracellular sulfur oxidation DsrE/DsrF family protein